MKPVLTNGLGSPQDHQEVSTIKHHELGTRGTDGIDRVWHYACSNSSGALTRGEILVTQDQNTGLDNLATVNAKLPAIGQTRIKDCITTGATAITADQFLDGMLHVVDGAGDATSYRIRSHTSVGTTSSTGTFHLHEGIRVAWDSDTEVTLIANDFYAVQQGTDDKLPVGVPNVTVPAGDSTPQYFWVQTAGQCSAKILGTPAYGVPLIISTTDGQIGAASEAATGGGGANEVNVFPYVGICHAPPGASGEIGVVNLAIRV